MPDSQQQVDAKVQSSLVQPNSDPFGADASRAAAPQRAASIDPMTIRLFWFLTILACLLLLRFFVPYFAYQVAYAIAQGRQRAQMEVASTGLKDSSLLSLSESFELISSRVGPSVVHISVLSIEELPDDEFASIFGYSRRQTQGQGSGVIIDANGYILTNNHVVRGATNIEVALSDGRRVPATVVGTDAATDLAVLKIGVDNLIATEWGDSDDLEAGAMVWALGSPFGLRRSITFGILSAKNREAGHLDFLQTDAAVNPGNSGGPLVDARGRLVGINTAIVGESYQGISFAIPSSTAKRTYEQLRSQGRVERGWLGVTLESVDERVAREWNLGVVRGALIVALARVPGMPSPAEQAGIRPGDIIVQWNGQPIHDTVTLIRLVAGTEVGARADVVVVRRGQELTVEVVVGKRPSQLD